VELTGGARFPLDEEQRVGGVAIGSGACFDDVGACSSAGNFNGAGVVADADGYLSHGILSAGYGPERIVEEAAFHSRYSIYRFVGGVNRSVAAGGVLENGVFASMAPFQGLAGLGPDRPPRAGESPRGTTSPQTGLRAGQRPGGQSRPKIKALKERGKGPRLNHSHTRFPLDVEKTGEYCTFDVRQAASADKSDVTDMEIKG